MPLTTDHHRSARKSAKIPGSVRKPTGISPDDEVLFENSDNEKELGQDDGSESSYGSEESGGSSSSSESEWLPDRADTDRESEEVHSQLTFFIFIDYDGGLVLVVRVSGQEYMSQ